jgi:3-isopropylmalate/(R)-2-methylmalate dehydratase large subunit
MAIVGQLLKGKKVKEGIQLIIVPATEDTWTYCVKEGLMEIFQQAGAQVLHPGCLGCYPNRPSNSNERQVIASTGNRNIKGMMGVSDIILCSPAIAAASAIAGYLATPWNTTSKIYTLPDTKVIISNKG